MKPSAAQIRMAFRNQLIRDGDRDVKIIVDGPIEWSGVPAGTPRVVQTVIVEASGKRPTRFLLVWADGTWRAHNS
jgi:hypothetical protein